MHELLPHNASAGNEQEADGVTVKDILLCRHSPHCNFLHCRRYNAWERVFYQGGTDRAVHNRLHNRVQHLQELPALVSGTIRRSVK